MTTSLRWEKQTNSAKNWERISLIESSTRQTATSLATATKETKEKIKSFCFQTLKESIFG